MNFRDRIVQLAGQYDGLKVQPSARMPLRHSGMQRPVSLRVDGPHDGAFIQAVGSSNQNTAYDHARSIFGDASELVPQKQRLAVIESDFKLEDWQVAGLTEVCAVVEEQQLNNVFTKLAA
jgi:hypothetical protein